MTAWADHLMIAPVLVPLIAGAAMLALDERRHRARAALGVAATLALVAIAAVALRAAATRGPMVYRLGNWPAPFGIVLVLDRLSAFMLVLTAILGAASLLFSLARWDRAGAHFHPLFQFLLMGLDGTFLTGDLFTLFVFFELLLVASYGLALHGSGTARVRAGLQYVAINLAASLLFLIGVALIYATSGSLTMAEIATRVAGLTPGARALFEAGAGVLGVALLVKAAMWPLCFWLPPTYTAASAPVAAIFALLSEVGVYIVLRLWPLVFGASAGVAAHFGGDWLVFGGMATLGFGLLGTLAAADMHALAGYAVLVSSGTLLAAIGLGDAALVGAALFYLASSTLALAAFFLLIELVERGHPERFSLVPETLPRGDAGAAEIGIATPRASAILGLSFMGCALLLAGLPPLSGFIGKFALLTALLDPAGAAGVSGVSARAWALFALLIVSGLATVITASRLGVRAFWGPSAPPLAASRAIEVAPIVFLLLCTLALSIEAGPALRYTRAAAIALDVPEGYVAAVLRPSVR